LHAQPENCGDAALTFPLWSGRFFSVRGARYGIRVLRRIPVIFEKVDGGIFGNEKLLEAAWGLDCLCKCDSDLI
jgi:hypothetical protein